MFICPKCRSRLLSDGKSLVCENGHCYDISRKGYVNLLISQRSSARHHGDDSAMAKARRDFLERGYYSPLRTRLCELVGNNSGTVLDAGCGECYYTEGIKKYTAAEVYGIDISGDILSKASPRTSSGIRLAVASCADIPLPDGACECIVSVFAPVFDSEFARVLCKNGRLLRVVPDINHLFSLKSAVYETPRPNDAVDTALDGFELVSDESLRFPLTLERTDDIISLFNMTPYRYRTSPDDARKLEALGSLETTAEFRILSYYKV